MSSEVIKGATLNRRLFAVSRLGTFGALPLALAGRSKPVTMEETS